MSSEDKDTQASELLTPALQADHRDVPGEDWLLQDVVRFINRLEGISIGITLTMSGGIITGDLINIKEFFYEYGKLWKEGFKRIPEAGAMLDQQWREHGDETAKHIKDANQVLFHYVHLKNARYMVGSTAISEVGGMLWRGRLSQIGGFSIGSFNRSKSG
jgi:hypothetical protein